MQDKDSDKEKIPGEEEKCEYQKIPEDNPPLVKQKKRPDLSELRFVRLIDPIHIPSYLVEQIKDRLFDVDKFYEYQKIICLIKNKNGPSLNPANYLYAITHERLRQVKGFLWMTLDYLTNSLIINNFSMDKEYWNRGESISLLETKAKVIMQDLHLNRIVWMTKNPKFCESRGFKRSKEAVMIFEGE